MLFGNGQPGSKHLRKRLGRCQRGDCYRAGRCVETDVISRDGPRSWESAELAGVDFEVERAEQLGGKNRGVQSWIKLRLRLAQCFLLFFDFKHRLLQISIIGARKRDRLVEGQYLYVASLCVCPR